MNDVLINHSNVNKVMNYKNTKINLKLHLVRLFLVYFLKEKWALECTIHSSIDISLHG